MNDYATPDNFKPGERWLVKDNEFSRELCEVRCLEWSPSGIRCKFEYVNSGSKNWSDTTHWYLVERLPDESKTNQTAEPARAVEDDSFSRHFKFFNFIWPCICDHCNQQKAKLKASHDQAIETIKQQAAQKEIAASHKPD